MANVAGHLREQNGTYQMVLSWKDSNGKRRSKSISTGLPLKGNKKRAEALLRKTQAEFNPDTMLKVSDLSIPEYLRYWLRDSVTTLSPDTYGRYAYDIGRSILPYFERKRLTLKALSPRDLEDFFRYERQQEEATVQQLLEWHKELKDAFQYAVENRWLKVNPILSVDPCLDNSPVLFTDFLRDWLRLSKSRVEPTTYANYEMVITRRIIPYSSRGTTPCRTWNSIPSISKIFTRAYWTAAGRPTQSFTTTPISVNASSMHSKSG